jgi:hypothetical protein
MDIRILDLCVDILQGYEPMARMPKVAREKFLLARGIHCCPYFLPRRTLIYYEEYIGYMQSIYIKTRKCI